MFHQRGATLHPVAVVAIERAVYCSHLGVVDMAANDTVDLALTSGARDRVLELTDELHRFLDLQLEEGGQRPVWEAEAATNAVEPSVQGQRRCVGLITQMCQPLVIADNAIELVAVQDQQPSAVSRHMDVVTEDLHAVEVTAMEGTQRLVMIAGHEYHTPTILCPTQDLAHHLVMGGRPIPAAFQSPSVDDIADKINLLGVCMIKEVEKKIGLAITRTKMDI